MLKAGLFAAISVAAAFPTAAQAEPASADPAFNGALGAEIRAARTVTQFELAGARLFIVATGRGAFVDTQKRFDDLREARALSKMMPGYPQPAYVTFDVRLTF